MVEAVANTGGGWRHSDAEFANAVEDWDDALREIPWQELNRVRQIGLASGKTKAAEFLALWKSNFVIPISVQAEEKQRRDERERFAADLNAGKFQRPPSSKIFTEIGRTVVCECSFDEREFRPGLNRRFIDDVKIAAQIIETLSGPRWRCARGQCGLDVDANKEIEVRAASVLPAIEVASKTEIIAREAASITQSRAELFCETVGRDWSDLTDAQKTAMGKMARWLDWLDWQRPRREATPENFESLWNEFHAQLEAA